MKLKGLSFEAFTPIWNEIFQEKPDSIALLRQLRGHYRLALLSNVNVMHWEHVDQRYDFLRWFDYLFASYAVGRRKPEADIFRIVLQRTGVPPERAVFIDDVLSHVRAAQALGIRAHQFHDAAHLRVQIRDLLE